MHFGRGPETVARSNKGQKKSFPKHGQNTGIITVALKLLFDLPVCTKASRVEPNLNTAKQILARLRAAQPARELRQHRQQP